ncbi:16797_t:CDS:2, partial [Funneliformis caledonium]
SITSLESRLLKVKALFTMTVCSFKYYSPRSGISWEDELQGKESLQVISSAIQEKQTNYQPYQLSRTNNYEREWSKNHHNITSPWSSKVSFSASQSNCSMDKNNGTQSLEATKNNQCLLEVKSGKDYQRCV